MISIRDVPTQPFNYKVNESWYHINTEAFIWAEISGTLKHDILATGKFLQYLQTGKIVYLDKLEWSKLLG